MPRRSFSITRCNSQALATHPHSLGDPLLGRDPWFEKHWSKEYKVGSLFTVNRLNISAGIKFPDNNERESGIKHFFECDSKILCCWRCETVVKQLITFSSCFSFRQFMPNKPDNYGRSCFYCVINSLNTLSI